MNEFQTMPVIEPIDLEKNKTKRKSFFSQIAKNKWYYIFLIPGITYFVIYHYLPMYGVTIAFRDYNLFRGMSGSPWVGLKHFRLLIGSSVFHRVFRNTVIISFYKLIFGFPVPIIVSLLLNELSSERFKRGIQSIIYIPHFISWAVLGGITYAILSPYHGALSIVFEAFDMKPINFLGSWKYFRGILVTTAIWKGFGWGTIVYLAALSSVDPALYESSKIDGAGRLQMMWHISLPSIRNVIVILFILRCGQIMNAGFIQVMSLYNPLVYEVAEIFDTYTFKVGIQQQRFSFTTAVGLFKSVIGLGMVLSANYLSRKFSEEGGLW
jgi:putative aldouronate transport system permease protein